MADYNEVRQSRLDQDERLKEFLDSVNPQPVDNMSKIDETGVQNSDSNLAEKIKSIKDYTKVESDIKDINKNLNKLIPDNNSPVNTIEDLLSRWKMTKESGRDSLLNNTENPLANPALIETNAINNIKENRGSDNFKPQLNKGDNLGLDTILNNLKKPEIPLSESGNRPLTPQELAKLQVAPVSQQTAPVQTSSPASVNQTTQNTNKTVDKVNKNNTIKGGNVDKGTNQGQELDPLAQFQNLLKLQDERNAADKAALAEANRQRNIDAAIGMITSGVSKAAAGYGGGSVTQLKGDTTTEEMLNKTADQKIADIKERMKNATDTEKDVLQKQLTLAQMQKMHDDKANDAEKLAIERAKLGIERNKLQIEKDKIGKEVPKISQDEIKMRAENRKTLKELDKDEQKTASLLKQIDDAQKTFENYSKNSIGGTGILSTVGGLTPLVSQKAGNLESKFNTLALKNLVSSFSGMSKAVDTDAERAIFQSTQPSLRNDDETNRENLRAMREAAQSMLDKIRAHKSLYNREGTFAQPSDEAQKLSDRSSGLAGKDKEAYNWASQNPNDPRAKQILQKLGM